MRTYQQVRAEAGSRAIEPAERALLRAIAAMALIGIGALHFLQIVPTFEATPLLGVAYVMFIAACVLVATWLVTRDDTRTWAAAGAISMAAVGGYVFTRVLSTPFDNQDVGNWSCMLGMAALFVEGVTVALSAYALQVAVAGRQHALATADLPSRRAAHQLTDRVAG
jgi:surface polysaccharide O-acyltransferase-like enzyme